MNLPYLLTSIYLLTGTYSYYPVEDVGIVDKIMTLRSYAKGCLKLREITFSYYNCTHNYMLCLFGYISCPIHNIFC